MQLAYEAWKWKGNDCIALESASRRVHREASTRTSLDEDAHHLASRTGQKMHREINAK
jgi:hypothetical protein